ncbi:DUF4367 domain-containing protein [Desulfolucanica intricata]|uniref:DUF4367 domain-containing protein n=1 Tax=Desulfolucanica intricata TaxID=1285191 RepID=UPI000832C845|nr:DUF4367 domain-containing protein [Desulfolucanica intricata]
MQKDNIDELIRSTLRERIDRNSPNPKADLIWSKIEHEINQIQKKNKNKFLYLSTAAIMVVFAIASLSYPQSVTAIGKKILKKVNTLLIGDSVIIRDRLTYEEKTPNGLQEPVSNNGMYKMDLDSLLKTATFKISIPQYLPEGYVLKDISWNQIDNLNGEAILSYIKNDLILLVRQKNITDEYTSGQGFDVEDSEVKEIKLKNGITATLIIREKNGWYKLSWIKSNIYYQVSGKMGQDEVIKIANSL